jgi:acyl-CoA reductase-like NAD-dependent aldehyde dehydrogenase
METRNPATGSVIATVPRGDRQDIDLAVAAARKAFDGPWSRFKPYERQVLLLKIADLFEKHWEEISRSDTSDMGMPIVRTRNEPCHRHVALLCRNGHCTWRRNRKPLPGERRFTAKSRSASSGATS